MDLPTFQAPTEAQMRALTDAAAKQRAIEARTERFEHRRFGDPLIDVTINAPHNAEVHGHSVSVNIEPPPVADPGTDLTGTEWLEDVTLCDGTVADFLVKNVRPPE